MYNVFHMENEEYRYIINVVYWYPYTNEDNKLAIKPVITTQEFKTRKEALASYKEIRNSKTIESKTRVGNVSFNVVSLELVDTHELKKLQEEFDKENARRESESRVESGSEPTNSDESGLIENANDEESSSEV